MKFWMHLQAIVGIEELIEDLDEEFLLKTPNNLFNREAVMSAVIQEIIRDYNSGLPLVNPEDYYCDHELFGKLVKITKKHNDIKALLKLLSAYKELEYSLDIHVCAMYGVVKIRVIYGN